MPLSQIQVGPIPKTSLGQGQQPTQMGGPAAEGIVAELHGKYYTQCYNGNVFIYSTAAAGVVPPIFSNTAQTFGIWNPSNSGKNIIPIKFQAGLVTVGVVTSNFCYGYVTNAGAQIATGSTISAATLVAPVNANLGNTNKSIANFAPATITSTAPSFLKNVGQSNFMATTPTAANMLWQLTEYYDGDLIISPGTALFVCNNIAGVATWDITMVCEEAPI